MLDILWLSRADAYTSSPEFTQGKPYALEGPNGRSFVTEQYAFLAQGKSEREFPFFACSEQPFSEVCPQDVRAVMWHSVLTLVQAEFNRYRQTMVVEGFPMPGRTDLVKKNQDIHRLINHQFTQGELEEKLRRQGTNDSKKQIYDRIQIERRRAQAAADGDEATVAACDAEMSRLAGPKLAFGTTLVKPRSTTEKTQQERLEDITRRNQRLNAENVRKAQLEERKKDRMNAAAVARGEALPDRFARVKTVARTYHDINQNRQTPGKPQGSSADTPHDSATGANTPNKTSTPNANGEKKQPKGVPTIRHRPHDDEIIGALDFGIDIDI